jgi:futalosine hydrolase
MKILLVAATQFEIEPILKKRIPAGEAAKKLDILISGVGIPSTIYHLTKKLLSEKYDVVIQAGIAGSFTKKLKRGKVVFVMQDTFGDLGISEKGKFKTLFSTTLADENGFPFEHGWLINKYDISKITRLKAVCAVTVNKIIDNKKEIKQLKKCFIADIESLEGAALHYVCLQQHIQFLQLRSISNYVGIMDKSKWKMKEAIENLNVELIRIINTIL